MYAFCRDEGDNEIIKQRNRCIQQYEGLLNHLERGIDYNYFLWSIDVSESDSYSQIENILCQQGYETLIRELKIWCFDYKKFINRIDFEKLDELSKWEDNSIKAFKAEKLNIEMRIRRYIRENLLIFNYLGDIPFYELIDAYIKSDNNEYQPEALKDVSTAISNELNRTIKDTNLDDETNSLAFYFISKLGKGGFGEVNLVSTNPIIIGTEARIAVKSIKREQKDK